MDNRIIVQIVAILLYIVAVVIVALGFFPDLIGIHSAILVPCFGAAFTLILLGLLASDVSDMKRDIARININVEQAEMMQKHMAAQTSILAMMAQNSGIERSMLNSLLSDVGLEIPDEKSVEGNAPQQP